MQARSGPSSRQELERFDLVFLALPHGASARVAKALERRVDRVIDLSGDLRLTSAEDYRDWYGTEHPAPQLLGTAVYGLPELFGEALPGAGLIACAGCYALGRADRRRTGARHGRGVR